MGKILKVLGILVGALVALIIVAILLVVLLVDPNDYRDEIAQRVQDATGREFTIEGDLSLSVFPWVAIEVGRTELGNAEGFGDEPFASFERASLSVKLIPFLFSRELSVGTAELESLRVNLAVDANGRSNWQDISERLEAAEQLEEPPPEAEEGAQVKGFAVGSIAIADAQLVYDNAQLGERYELTGLGLRTGSVNAGEPVDLSGGFSFTGPDDLAGRVDLSATVQFAADASSVSLEDFEISGAAEGATPLSFEFSAPAMSVRTEDRVADIGDMRLEVFDVVVEASVEPFSYADSPQPTATIRINAFSPRTLMQNLGIEAPETADPGALERLMLSANLAVTDSSMGMTNLELELDDTTFTGALAVPRDSDGTYELDLAADSINVSRYMAPATDEEEAAAGEEVPIAIPVDIIRALNARGSLRIGEAQLGRLVFEDITLDVNSANGRLRMHPISAQFLDGAYNGDIRIDASGEVTTLSVNERIENVNLGALAMAMFETDKVTGQINGTFVLTGRGNEIGEMQRNLNGNMSFVLSDGAWEGTDVWYQLRRARAMFKREEPPEPELPARTRFSEVSATGVVTSGVLVNEDFSADLPFMQLSGRGSVDIPAGTIDYSLTGRVLNSPELADAATAEEIEDLTSATIPLKISGPLAEPDIGVDFEALIRDRAEEELRDAVLDRLFGGDEEEPAEGEEAEEEEEDPEDLLRNRLRDLIDDG